MKDELQIACGLVHQGSLRVKFFTPFTSPIICIPAPYDMSEWSYLEEIVRCKGQLRHNAAFKDCAQQAEDKEHCETHNESRLRYHKQK